MHWHVKNLAVCKLFVFVVYICSGTKRCWLPWQRWQKCR